MKTVYNIFNVQINSWWKCYYDTFIIIIQKLINFKRNLLKMICNLCWKIIMNLLWFMLIVFWRELLLRYGFNKIGGNIWLIKILSLYIRRWRKLGQLIGYKGFGEIEYSIIDCHSREAFHTSWNFSILIHS